MLRTHRAGKGPGGCGGLGLGSRNRKGPGMPPTPGLRGQGTSPGSPAGFLGSSWGANTILSTPAPLVWEGPSYLPLLISLASLLCPQGPTQPGWGFGGQWTGLGAQQFPQARVGGAVALRSSAALTGESFPPASPDLPSLRGADPVWPPLLPSPSPVPLHPTSSLWGFSHLLGHQSLPPAAGSHPTCVEMLTLCLLTPPS